MELEGLIWDTNVPEIQQLDSSEDSIAVDPTVITEVTAPFYGATQKPTYTSADTGAETNYDFVGSTIDSYANWELDGYVTYLGEGTVYRNNRGNLVDSKEVKHFFNKTSKFYTNG